MRHSETGLPDDITQPTTKKPGYSTGMQTQISPRDAIATPTDAKPRIVRHGNHRFTSRTVDTASISRAAVGAALTRRYLLIQNVGAVTVFLGFGVTPSITGDNSIELPAGVAIAFENGIVPNTEIEAISATGSKLAIIEGTDL